MKVSVVSCVCDRPEAFALTERWVARQTRQPDEWVVADGGARPVECIAGQIHLRDPRPPGAENLCHNVLNAAAMVSGDVIVFFEDDYYFPSHIATLVAALETRPDALLAGYGRLHYYHVGRRAYREMDNSGSSLAQTALRRSALPMLREVAYACLAERSYAIDRALWIAAGRAQWALVPQRTCIGIKGMPGPPGLGRSGYVTTAWRADERGLRLRAWIGEDAEAYEQFAQ